MTTLHRTPTSPDDLARIAHVREMCATGEAKRIRQTARVAVREVAHVVGVDPSTVAAWENGSRTCASPYALAYADALRAISRYGDPTR